jgi:hypothetical protein
MHCSGPNGVNLPAFLWRGHSQSGFNDSVGRTQCDRKPTMRRKRLDLSLLPTSPFLDNFLFADKPGGDRIGQQKPVYEDSTHLLSLAKS